MFLDRLFKRNKGEIKEVTQKVPKKKNAPKNTVENKISYKFDPEVQKKVEKEELKIAEKIAKEELIKYHKEINNHRDKIKKQAKTQGSGVKNSNGIQKSSYQTGIPGFDRLLRGNGIPMPTSVLVEGGPGSGKTIFCLHVAMEFCEQGKKVLYMTFEEAEERLVQHMESFGFNATKYVKNGQLVIKRFNALDIARSVEALLSEAKKELLIEVQPILIPKEIEPDLVLVDSLTSIASAFSGEESRFRIYMEQLFRYLEENGISALLIREVANPGHVGNVTSANDEATSFLSDGIIIFYNVIFNNGDRTRALEILKLRGQDFDRRIVEASIINKKGLVIYDNKPLKGKYRLT